MILKCEIGKFSSYKRRTYQHIINFSRTSPFLDLEQYNMPGQGGSLHQNRRFTHRLPFSQRRWAHPFE